jgi:5-(carboxyamino)imidazole ribonucleotide mutase
MTNVPQNILIRFNTQSTHDANRWRLIIDGREHLVGGVVIDGRVATSKDWVKEVSDYKWHINCKGNIEIKDNTAYVSSAVDFISDTKENRTTSIGSNTEKEVAQGGISGGTQSVKLVGIVMGSKSDLPIMKQAAEVLQELGVSSEVRIVSAHRTPLRMVDYAETAASRGIKVVIAGAGGAAHLPGMIASICPLPVVGVPVKSSQSMDGWDSVLSILQMPGGIPVATVALNGAKNAALLAAQMLAISDSDLAERLAQYRARLRQQVETDAASLENQGWQAFLG